MNTRVAFGFRPRTNEAPTSWEHGTWLCAVAVAIGFIAVAAIMLPHALIAPAVALALFAASPIPMLLTWRMLDARRENARLFAGVLFALGVLAALFADPARIATYLG